MALIVQKYGGTSVGSPERINQDAYAAWIFKLAPSDPGELATLMDAAAYEGTVNADQD